MAPQWVNIRRGTVVVSVVGGWALCPWIIVASAQSFLSFMSAYAIFMAPIAGILATDYWAVKRRRYDVPALYDPKGIYSFGWGGNWRALVTTLVVIVPLLPALGQKVTPDNVSISKGLENLFSFNWLYGFVTSVFLYYVLNYFFPHRATLIDKAVLGYRYGVQAVEADEESRTSGRTSPKELASHETGTYEAK